MHPNVLFGRVSSRALHRILVAGIVAGFLLTPIAPALPERAQSPGVYGGIALSLLCIAILLAQLAKDTQLEWRGLSPAVGILIGAVVFGVPAGWHLLADHRSDAARAPTTIRGTAPAARASAAMPALAQTTTPHVQESAGSPSPNDPQAADPLLDQVSATLTAKGRPAIQAVIPMTMAARALGPGGTHARLTDITAGLADLQRSLERIKSENPDRRRQLDGVLGDPTALAELNSALARYGGSLQGMTVADGVSTQQLRTAAAGAIQWMNECQGRIAALRASGATE